MTKADNKKYSATYSKSHHHGNNDQSFLSFSSKEFARDDVYRDLCVYFVEGFYLFIWHWVYQLFMYVCGAQLPSSVSLSISLGLCPSPLFAQLSGPSHPLPSPLPAQPLVVGDAGAERHGSLHLGKG